MNNLDKKHIPFVDLYSQYRGIKKEIDNEIFNVIEKSAFIRGEYVEKFEEEFSKKIGSKYCISCANGTDAIYIAMKALGVQPDDEIIVPAHSWISTSETVTQAGGKIVFCDTNNYDFTIDVNEIEKKITSKTVGIIPVHLYGQSAEIDKIIDIAKKNNLWVIEDCAQAHLAKNYGKNVGTFGDISTFSFYPGKNLGAMGDAGAILTNNEKLQEDCAKFARHGGLKKGDHEIEGVNSRMDGIQAAILSVKLKYSDKWTKKRQDVSTKYNESLKSIKQIDLPIVRKNAEHVWHLYVIKTEMRDELALFLRESGIQVGINYPVALPFLPAYKRLGHKPEDFPNAYSNQSKILSLPIFPELSDEDIHFVADQIKLFFNKND